MLNAIKQRKDQGFTIVEVMIVLAIAGLIILVVFLAVPALQRNSRNTQRSNDAGLVGGGVNECLSNRNGQADACDTPGELQAYVDTNKLRQFTTLTVTKAAEAPSIPGNTDLDTISVDFGSKCDTAGAAPVAGPARSAVVLFNTESNSATLVTRCQEI